MKKYKQAYATKTSEIIRKILITKNPVTRASYIDILGNRIDRLELNRLQTEEK